MEVKLYPLTWALDGSGWSTPRPSRPTPDKKSQLLILQEAECLGLAWTGAENIALTGIRTQNNPDFSESNDRPYIRLLHFRTCCYGGKKLK
jgi:hypothetical protein